MAWWPKSLGRLHRRRLFTAFVLLGSFLILLAISWGSFRVAERIERQASLSTWLLSHFASLHLGQGQTEGLREVLLRTSELDVPFIVTDNQGRPLLWNAPVVGVPLPDTPETIIAADPDGVNPPDIQRVLDLVKEYDAQHEPYAIHAPITGQRIMTLHYGSSALSRSIRWLPYLELALLSLFFLMIVWALSLKRDREQQRLFAGMAKETAHQLGTPITSIMGWLAILRDRETAPDLIEELDRDVARLGKVSERFSQIGSKPQLNDTDLAGVVETTVQYFERRIPHLGGRVDLAVENRLTVGCRFNRDLLEWVLENLVKNGIDALIEGRGAITVRLDDGPAGGVELRVVDTGGGIEASHRNRIFEAGFTTKRRGWGMGLALVKRIVTQYHGGRIAVESTGPGGTVILINLPGEEA
jgi:hypothetical protein